MSTEDLRTASIPADAIITTFTSDGTLVLPAGAVDVNYTIHGGKGGQGGPASTRVNTNGAAGARGQKIVGELTNVGGTTLTITLGGNGSRCFGDTGANGGSGYWNGGRGGNNNSSDSGGFNAGGGGGGGGASAIRIGSTVLAGAGGGGGGACICYSTNGALDAGQQSSDINTSGGSNGANGQNSGASFNGGGGGAGGGYPGGTTGFAQGGYAWQSGNDGSGFGGAGGAGLRNPSYHSSDSSSETPDSDSSYCTIWYRNPIPEVTLSVSSTAIDRGQTVTLTWTSTAGSDITRTFTDNFGNTILVNPIASGSIAVTPLTGTTTYTFEASNVAGTTTASVTVVTTLLAPTASLTTDDIDNIVLSGQEVELTWSGTGYDVSSYTMTGVANPGASGSIVVTPTTTTTYTYTVVNATATRTSSKTLSVIYPPSFTLSANKSSITPGEQVVLTWSTSGTANQIVWVTNAPPSSGSISGSSSVFPGETTQYCAYVTGPAGTSSTVCANIFVQGEQSATNYNATYSSNGSHTWPANAYGIGFTLAAGGGGVGGNDSAPGGQGGGGRKTILYFPSYQSRTVSWILGSKGGNGFGCVSNSGAGGGGGGASSGGSGGRTGPQGCSGGGGGGGGSSRLNASPGGTIAIVGGGGGGGGGSHPGQNLRGGNGGSGRGMTSGNGSLSNGGTGTSQGYDGAGGGGGGGGAPGGGGGREGADDRAGNYPSGGGTGGASWYNSSVVSYSNAAGSLNYGNGYAAISYQLAPPTVNSFTVTNSAFIRGGCTTLAWTSSFALAADMSGVGSVAANGSVEVCPLVTTTYTLTVFGYGGTSDNSSRTITVYIPPILLLSAENTSIVVGGSTNISWTKNADGDADTLYWTSGGLTNNLITSNANVSPTDTTTYCGYLTGLGGTSPTACITITVFQIPSIEDFQVPGELFYGQQGTVIAEYKYANSSATINIYFSYLDGNPPTLHKSESLTPSGSAELNGINILVGSQINTQVVYNDFGPREVIYELVIVGSGGFRSETKTVPIIIDETPDNISIQETDEKFATQEPVYTPDVVPEQVLESELYEINDIDIPVEIKSNYPIKVDINKNGSWDDVRSI